MSQLCHQSGERNRETSCKQDGFKSMFASFRIALLPTDHPSQPEYAGKRSKVYVGRETILEIAVCRKTLGISRRERDSQRRRGKGRTELLNNTQLLSAET